MKILILNGSPRANGNTVEHIEAFMEGLKGHEAIVLPVGKMRIRPCMACQYCKEIDKGVCIQQDDMFKVYEVISDADMIVFASPIHFYGLSGQLQAMMSRFHAVLPKAKKYALFTSSVDEGAAEAVVIQYKKCIAYFGGEDMGIFCASDKENHHPEFLSKLKGFAQSL